MNTTYPRLATDARDEADLPDAHHADDVLGARAPVAAPATPAGAPDEAPGPGATRFAAFTPMNDQPGLADRKATFVIAAGGLLLSTMLFFVTPLSQFAGRDFSSGLAVGLTFALSCVTLIGIRTAYRCYTLPAPTRPANPLFFQNIAAGELPAYATKLRGATERDTLHAVLDFNHTMATLGATKYRLAGQALLCLRVAIPLWVMLLTVVALRGEW